MSDSEKEAERHKGNARERAAEQKIALRWWLGLELGPGTGKRVYMSAKTYYIKRKRKKAEEKEKGAKGKGRRMCDVHTYKV